MSCGDAYDMVYVCYNLHMPGLNLSVDAEQIAKDYSDGLSIRQVAMRHGVSTTIVYHRLNSLGVVRRQGKNKVHSLTPEEAASEYGNGATLSEIGHRHGMSVCAVLTRLNEAGVKRRKARGHCLSDPEVRRRIKSPRGADNPAFKFVPIDRATALYGDGWSTSEIGKVLGVSAGTIARKLRDAGVALRSSGLCRRRRCKDGHIVLSSFEYAVDNWLSERGLPHDVGPCVPWYRGGKSPQRADFLVCGTYIEVWGIVGRKDYDRKRRAKQRRYRDSGSRLIDVFPHDVLLGNLKVLEALL